MTLDSATVDKARAPLRAGPLTRVFGIRPVRCALDVERRRAQILGALRARSPTLKIRCVRLESFD